MSRENESVGACAPQAGDGRPDGGTLLSARDLTVCYGSNEALHPTSLDFAAGQVTALIDLYSVSELPLCYLIDKDRKILLKSENNLEVKDVLDELLEE